MAKRTYRLYPLDAAHDPDRLMLNYAWASFDNTAWRPCVDHFMSAVEARGHEVVAIPPPPFQRGEDFVSIGYLLDGVPATFACDLLLSSIEITTEDPRVLRAVWQSVGDEVGWVTRTAPVRPSRWAWVTALWCRLRGR